MCLIFGRRSALVGHHRLIPNSHGPTRRDETVFVWIRCQRNLSASHLLIFFVHVGTARVVCRAGSMQLSGVRPSVCSSVPSGRCTPLLQVCCFGPSGQEISIYCCTAVSSKCEQYHVVGWCGKLGTDLFIVQAVRSWRTTSSTPVHRLFHTPAVIQLSRVVHWWWRLVSGGSRDVQTATRLSASPTTCCLVSTHLTYDMNDMALELI